LPQIHRFLNAKSAKQAQSAQNNQATRNPIFSN